MINITGIEVPAGEVTAEEADEFAEKLHDAIAELAELSDAELTRKSRDYVKTAFVTDLHRLGAARLHMSFALMAPVAMCEHMYRVNCFIHQAMGWRINNLTSN